MSVVSKFEDELKKFEEKSCGTNMNNKTVSILKQTKNNCESIIEEEVQVTK